MTTTTTQTKRTPGPWTVSDDPESAEGFYSVWFDQGGTGAEIAGRIGERANASLIALAPSMMEALKQAHRLFGGHSGLPDDPITRIEYEQHANVLDQIKALLTRLEG